MAIGHSQRAAMYVAQVHVHVNVWCACTCASGAGGARLEAKQPLQDHRECVILLRSRNPAPGRRPRMLRDPSSEGASKDEAGGSAPCVI